MGEELVLYSVDVWAVRGVVNADFSGEGLCCVETGKQGIDGRGVARDEGRGWGVEGGDGEQLTEGREEGAKLLDAELDGGNSAFASDRVSARLRRATTRAASSRESAPAT